MYQRTAFFIALLLFVLQSAFADTSDVKVTPSGFAYYQIGQIERMSVPGSDIPKAFDQHFNGRLTLDAVVSKNVRIIVGGEAQLGFNIHSQQKLPDNFALVLKEAQGIYSFGNDPSHSILKVAAGYFPFKYNPQSSNLGEYLFRTGTYPGYVITDFDNAKARLFGFNLTATPIDNLQLNALFTSEYVVKPYWDYSLAFVAGYKTPDKLFDFGAGIDFDRLLPIDPTLTTSNQVATDKQGNPIIENGDTLKYTMKGTKLMGRVTFDPKPLLPFSGMFGPEDGKLYSEVAVLGVKNYGAYYYSISKRIPVMVGFNVPCFNVLDLVSCEFEYYGSDSTQELNIPQDADPTPSQFPIGIHRSYTKWSVFFQKTLAKGVALKFLFGRDHYRAVDAGGAYDIIEHLNAPGDWHYNLRLMYSF